MTVEDITKLAVIDPLDAQAAIAAKLPPFDDPRKVEYLVLTSLSFTHAESLNLIGISDPEFKDWADNDTEFYAWCTFKKWKLQDKVGEQVLRARFMRCVFLQLNIDGQLLAKRAFNFAGMTPEERMEAREASKRYTAGNINAMFKVLEPEREEASAPKVIEFNVYVDGGQLGDKNAKQAAARSLLDKFTKEPGELDEVVEGEVVSSD